MDCDKMCRLFTENINVDEYNNRIAEVKEAKALLSTRG